MNMIARATWICLKSAVLSIFSRSIAKALVMNVTVAGDNCPAHSSRFKRATKAGGSCAGCGNGTNWSNTYNGPMNVSISKGGQISLPAPIRKRWKTMTVVLEDLGDRVVLRPIPADPIAAAKGALPSRRRTAEKDRRRARREEGAGVGR